MKKKLRVVVIGTGNVAGVAIRCLKGREDMELVGVWAHKETAPQHIGMDSGLLDLNEPNGEIGRATRLNSSHSAKSRMPSSA